MEGLQFEVPSHVLSLSKVDKLFEVSVRLQQVVVTRQCQDDAILTPLLEQCLCFGVAGISFLVLLTLLIGHLYSWRKTLSEDIESTPSQRAVPLPYHLARFLSQLAAIIFSALDATTANTTRFIRPGTSLYVFLLGTVHLALRNNRYASRILLLHENLVAGLVAGSFALKLAPFTVFIGCQIRSQDRWLFFTTAAFALTPLITFISPRQWNPPAVSFGLAQRDTYEASPEQTCSYLSYFMTYNWLTPIIKMGSKRRLTLTDVLPLPDYDEPLIWRERILQARKQYKTTAKTLFFTLHRSISRMVLYAASTAVTEFIAPLSLYQLLQYLQNPHAAVLTPWIWVCMMFAGPVLRSASYQQYIFNSTRLIVRTKLCLIQELYMKAGKSCDFAMAMNDGEKKPTKGQKNGGEEKSANVTNLMAYDVDAICNSRDLVLVCTATPIEITIGMTFLYKLFGPCAFISLGIMFCSFPLATLLSRRMSKFQKEVMKRTDSRVSIISEYLNCIRTIKYLAWENIMSDRIDDERRGEETLTWKRNLAAVAVITMGDFVPLFSLFSMFFVHTIILKQPLTAAKAFTALSVIETLRLQFVWVANVTKFLSQALVAFARIDGYMANEPESSPHPEGAPGFQQAVFCRTLAEDSFELSLDSEFVVNALNVVTGASGSGKTSLLLSLLGETVLVNGTATCPKDVAYAAQVPWLINASIQTNILMYEPFDAERYQKTIEACALIPDFEKLPLGDKTEVGANGANLSGGQRQRVSLARAIYSRAATLLLDDVFSALDSTTQRHIWTNCFHGDLVENRTVIMVTPMQVAKDAAALVIEMSNGVISATTKGPRNRPKHASPSNPKTSRSYVDRGIVFSNRDTVSNPLIEGNFHEENEAAERIRRETAGQQRNSRTLFYQYMLLFGGHKHALLAILLCLSAQLAFFFIPLWLSVWVGSYSKEDARDVGFYTATYGLGLISFTLFSALSQTYFQLSAWTVAHVMHKKLVKAVMSVSIHWYNNNPVGQVVNRFSRDIFSLDSILVEYLRITLDNGLRFLLRLTAIGSIMPIFGVPALLICCVGFACAEMYTRTQLSVKAISSAAQSPIFSFFSESLAGRSAIRARLDLSESFANALSRRLRLFARAAETQYNLNRWICVRADGCAAIIAFAAGSIAISLQSRTTAGLVGFSLTNAIGLGQTILNLVRNMNELEVELNSFYRVREYAALPAEERLESKEEDYLLPPLWPSKGHLEFRNVTVKYVPSGPDVLQNVSLTIQPGEKVSVIGRTGSGKSTLALSLLGFTTITRGAIFIDGIDISKIPVRTLRKRLTIIPQEPVLFGGSVRFNLDPSETSDWKQLADAVDTCSNMASLGNNTDGGSISINDSNIWNTAASHSPAALQLDTVVAPQGLNFSLGQRQVLSLARATIRQSRVVILDEATASVDHKSDAAIQEVLSLAFQERTMISIVHRLSSIMSYDKVIVMESGKIREIGPPSKLFELKGIFHDMVLQSIQQGKGGEWSLEKLEKLGL